MEHKKKILKDIIKKEALYPVYQPIVSMKDGSVFGYEALTRIKKFESGITMEFIKKYGLEPKDVVFEITERTPIRSKNLFKKVLKHYTRQDYLKLDTSIIRGIESDDVKKSLVKHMIHFSKEVSIKTIAEGIETIEEAEILKELGADLGQGYYYARPSEGFGEIL